MLRRKYRKMPRDFGEFERRFGWSTEHAARLLGGHPLALKPEKVLRGLANEYLQCFRKEPEKTHLFPNLGAHFHYWFAKGVADAAGIKARIRTITPLRYPDSWIGWMRQEHLVPQIEKLRLHETGIVLHDFVSKGTTLETIASFSKIPIEEVQVHRLAEQQVLGSGVDAPVLGRQIRVAKALLSKEPLPGEKVKFSKSMTEKEYAFVCRAAYAAGVAATKELLGRKTR